MMAVWAAVRQLSNSGEAAGRRDETDSRAERGKNGMLPSKDYKKLKKGYG